MPFFKLVSRHSTFLGNSTEGLDLQVYNLRRCTTRNEGRGESWCHLKFGSAPLFIPGSITGDRDTGDKCWDKNLLKLSLINPKVPQFQSNLFLLILLSRSRLKKQNQLPSKKNRSHKEGFIWNRTIAKPVPAKKLKRILFLILRSLNEMMQLINQPMLRKKQTVSVELMKARGKMREQDSTISELQKER